MITSPLPSLPGHEGAGGLNWTSPLPSSTIAALPSTFAIAPVETRFLWIPEIIGYTCVMDALLAAWCELQIDWSYM